MRRMGVLIITTMLFLSTASAMAQEYKQAFSYQLRFGLTSTYITRDDYPDAASGWGLAAGGGLFLPMFSERFGLQAEALYVSKEVWLETTGLNESGLPPSPVEEYEFNTKFVEIPLLAQWAFTVEPGFRAYLLGGQVLSMRLESQVKYVNDLGEDVTEDLEGLAEYDWGPMAGIGVIAGRLLAEVRFSWGLKSIGEENEAADTKFNTMSFILGFAF